MDNMLTLEEVRNYLEIQQEEVERYIKQDRLHAYKIGGVYLRFRKDEVLNLRHELFPKKKKIGRQDSVFSRLLDFWRFNNIYILAFVLVVLITIFVVHE